MIINPLIIKVFKPLNIPVVFCEYTGESDKYIVFSTTGQYNDEYSDDEANFERINIGLNYYYKNPEDIVLINDINRILKENKFKIISQKDVIKNGSDYFNRSYYLSYTSSLN